MRNLKDRVRSERGASFLLAMLFFLICATVASIVLLSASTNVEHVKQTQEEEQAYLSLSSAAQTLKDIFERKAPEYIGTTKDGAFVRSIMNVATGEALDSLTDRIRAACDASLMGAGNAYSSVFEINPGSAAADNVTCTLTIENSTEATLANNTAYDIRITCTSSSEDYRYTVTLNLKASVDGPNDDQDGSRVTKVTWPIDQMNITRGKVSLGAAS